MMARSILVQAGPTKNHALARRHGRPCCGPDPPYLNIPTRCGPTVSTQRCPVFGVATRAANPQRLTHTHTHSKPIAVVGGGILYARCLLLLCFWWRVADEASLVARGCDAGFCVVCSWRAVRVCCERALGRPRGLPLLPRLAPKTRPLGRVCSGRSFSAGSAVFLKTMRGSASYVPPPPSPYVSAPVKQV